MEDYEPYLSLAVALAAGLLIGLQREQAVSPKERQHSFLGGARTYPMFSLAGALAFLVGGVILVAVVLVALLALIAIAYVDDVRHNRDKGLTSEGAMVVTFLLGTLAVAANVVAPSWKRFVLTMALAVVVTLLLTAKSALHGLAGRISRDDVYATLKFLIVVVIVLPLLPDETYGPFDVLNPFEIGVFICIVAGVGFAGYVAIRVLGPGRGLFVTGFLGGLVSSTAVTLAFSGHAREESAVREPSALAVVLASTIMAPRVILVVGAVYPPLLPYLLAPLGAMLLAGMLSALPLYLRVRRRAHAAHEVKFANPFELGLALKFGAIFVVVLLASKAAMEYLGVSGTYAAAALAGLSDVDAISLSMAKLGEEGVAEKVLATTIAIAAASNTLMKLGLAMGIAGWTFAKSLVPSFAAMLLGAGAGVAALWLL